MSCDSILTLNAMQAGCVTTCWTSERRAERVPVGVLLRKEEEGVMGGVTGGVRLPLVWRGGVETLLRDRLPVRDRDNLGCAFFFRVSCSRRAASVMNLAWRERRRRSVYATSGLRFRY